MRQGGRERAPVAIGVFTEGEGKGSRSFREALGRVPLVAVLGILLGNDHLGTLP